jgi:hypothetical protein
VRGHRHLAVEVAGPDQLDGARQLLDRPEDGAAGQPGQQARQHRRRRQAAAQPGDRGGRLGAGVAAGLLHVLLVDAADLLGDVLDLAEQPQQAVVSALVEIGLAPLRRIRELVEGVAGLAVSIGQFHQFVHQLLLARQGDVFLLVAQVPFILRPVLPVRLLGVGAAGQGELERRVDALQGLVQADHGHDAGVILTQDQVDAAPQAVQQDQGGAAQQGQQGQQRGQRQQQAIAQGKGHDRSRESVQSPKRRRLR